MLRLFTILLLIIFMNTAEAIRAVTQQAQTTVFNCNNQASISRTNLAVDDSGKKIVVMWQAKSSQAHIYFSSSSNGGKSWIIKDQRLQLDNTSFNHYIGEMSFTPDRRLEIVYIKHTDKQAPSYSYSDDLGSHWTKPVVIGKSI